MKNMLYILGFFLCVANINKAQWQTVQPFTLNNQTDVCYSEAGKIFVVCEEGTLFEKSDTNWYSTQLTNGSTLNSVNFFDETTGFVTGEKGAIFKTEDVGLNWISCGVDSIFNLQEMIFVNNEKGITVGSKEVRIDGNIYYLPAILTTSDYGQTWVEKEFDFTGSLNSVCHIRDGFLIAVGDSGLILSSDDFGESWLIESLGITTNLTSINVCPDYTTVVTGDLGICFYSFDAGGTWGSVTLPYYYNLKESCFNGYVYAAGTKEVHIDGRTYYMAAVLKINTETNEWIEEFSQVRGTFSGIKFCNGNTGIAIGDSGLVAVYDDGSLSVTESIATPGGFELFQNYPNPFNPITKIRWQLPDNGHQTLNIFDILGNEVRMLVNEYRNAGIYEIDFDATDLASGIYFYRLQAGKYSSVKRMIFLK